ncbi:DMT family transporter [Pseudoprimorskyibacter insulae]|uniref:Riboflavin transporter n=1 Tax=Pseudoprimorskyibacter insulae TaxID=1695997 RepID=A0A2R8AXU6_9RHOB|nr:DMT family transporter [Pseudoprimorskyibacter insulae]SPF80787.1 Riboflavin transporter [Pseudoprimorskyibacter insulae]
MDNVKGILFMVLAMASFSVEDFAIKLATQHVPYSQITLALGGVATLLFGLMCWRYRVKILSPILRHPAMLIRIGAEAVGFSSFIVALSLVPLAVASAIVQATPLLIAAGAALVYGERVGPRRWFAVIAGFVGVLIVLRPGTDGFDPNAMFAVVAAIGLAVRDLCTRSVPREAHTLFLSFWGFAAMLPSALMFMVIGAPPIWPSAQATGLLALIVATGMAGYGAITISLRSGEMSAIAPYRYLRLVFTLIIAAVILGERPDGPVLLGAILIVGSGLYSIWRESLRRTARR